MTIRLADDDVGGVPIDLKVVRYETIMLEMGVSIELIEYILEDKAILTAKRAMMHYSETLDLPWILYEENLTVSVKEIVDRIEGQNNFPLSKLLGDSGLISWVYSNEDMASEGYTAWQWSNILDREIAAPSFEHAVVMWQDAVK